MRVERHRLAGGRAGCRTCSSARRPRSPRRRRRPAPAADSWPTSRPLRRPITPSLPFRMRRPRVETRPSCAPCAWQIAQASASAASGDGSPGSASRRRTMCCTCSLRGMAVADHRLLHLQRGVFGDRQAGEHRSADRRAARLAEREGRLRIDVDEHLLDRDLDRAVRGDDSRSGLRGSPSGAAARSPSPDFTQPLVT